MAQTPPVRSRPNLHIALARPTGSPRRPSYVTPASSVPTTPNGTPFATTAYSPFRSAGLKPPTPYEGTIDFSSKRSSKPGYLDSYTRFRLKRMLSSRPLWLFVALVLLTYWWLQGGSRSHDIVRLDERRLGRDLSSDARTKGLQFFPASNPKIHYVGRWSATPNRLRKDGTFPGVYFDLTVQNTTTLYLSLHNAPDPHKESKHSLSARISAPPSLPSPGRLSFRPLPANEKPAAPISLLAGVDSDEYVLLANSSNLVVICPNDLARDEKHNIRIGAPMTDDGSGLLELEGLWLSKGGQLLRVQGSLLSEEYINEDKLSAKNDQVGEKHRNGLHELIKGKGGPGKVKKPREEKDLPDLLQERKRILEVITDSPGSFRSKHDVVRSGGSESLFAGVMGWEYLLGEMFGADHVGIGVDGMCLIQDCIGGVGTPAGMGDVFFRSGPYGSHYFEHPWMFDAYIPDVIVLNIGGSDQISFDSHLTGYNKTMWDLVDRFEQTYVSLLTAIRSLAYPKHPTVMHSEQAGYPGFVPSSTPATIPIFVMRPLRGQLEHATQNVVNKIRADGDKGVFWLDTSGWLDLEDTNTHDMFFDDSVSPPKWRLTKQGNQRVAIFLHMHVCRYLAGSEEKCPFLPHEVYQGKVFDPVQANFDRFLEDEKERKLKKLFWSQDSDEELDLEVGTANIA